jgi:hypothetical protein
MSASWGEYVGGGFNLPSNRSKSQKIAKWFNTSAFTVSPIGTIGTPLRKLKQTENSLRHPLRVKAQEFGRKYELG